jgi:phage gp29-like protein
VTAPLATIELNRATIEGALAALRDGRSTGNPMLDHVVDALRRSWAHAWARLRRACPDLPEAEIDFATSMAVDTVALDPDEVLRLLHADAARCAEARGAS